MTENFEEQKVIVDLTGEPQESKYEKVLIEEGERPGVFKSFKLKQLPKFGKPDVKEAKIIVQVEVNDKKKGAVEIPLFLSPFVIKAVPGSGKSNSGLYEVLDKLKLLQDFGDANDVANNFNFRQLTDWLENVLTGRVARVLVETTKKSKTPYSKVGNVYGFVEKPTVDATVNKVDGEA